MASVDSQSSRTVISRTEGNCGNAPLHVADATRIVIYQIRKLMQAAALYTKELHKTYAVSATQLACLSTIYEHGPLPPSQIAKLILVQSSTVTGIIDRLEKKGLVKRARISNDRRVITIELTDAGKELTRDAPPPIQRKIVEGLKKLPPQEIDNVIEMLSKLTQMLDVDDLPLQDDAMDQPF